MTDQSAEVPADVEEVWQNFWVGAIKSGCEERGEPTLMPVPNRVMLGTEIMMGTEVFNQIKRELFDFHAAMQVVPEVYSHATGGAMSKITYNDVSQICGVIDESYAERWHENIAEAIAEAADEIEMTKDQADVVEMVLQSIVHQLDVPDEILEMVAKERQRRKLAEERPIVDVELPAAPDATE